jgi:adenylylsulfate kinase-like enzyme
MGGLVWITGLSGAGKNSLARRVVDALRGDGVWVLHVGGDAIRHVFGDPLVHVPEDRRTNAWRIARTCAYLAGQGALVVCSTAIVFPEIAAFNRDAVHPYLEVYLDVPMDLLRERQPRGIDRARVDMIVSRPADADLYLTNGTAAELAANARLLHARALAMVGAPSVVQRIA